MNSTEPADALQEALALHRQGKHDLAMQRYVAILQKSPNNADALYYIAALALQQGQLAEGLKVIGRAVEVGAPQARLFNLKGQAHLRLNQDEAAVEAFGRAIETDPSFADAYGNRATLLCELDRAADAIADFDRALELRPNNPEDHCNRASAMADLGRYDEALAGFARAISLQPAMAAAYFNRADVLRRIGRLPEALRDYEQMIALHSNHPAAHSNRGLVLKELGRLDEAKASLQRALDIDPGFVEGLVNRGNLALEQGQPDAAAADYTSALGRQPEFAEAKHGLALAALHRGDWDKGFALYDAREKLRERPFKPLPLPRCSKDAPAAGRLLLLCEQGLGDMIQFSRFATVFAERGHDVTLLAPPSMTRLLSTLPGVTVAAAGDAPSGDDPATRWLPLMSVPSALGVQPDSIPGKVPFLSAEPERVARWAAWLGGDGFRIGINWSAGAGAGRGAFQKRRDIPLADFAPLAALPGVKLVSLQKGPALQQIATAAFRDTIMIPETDPDPAADNFVDTAALMQSLDLIVSCDTAVPHLAGALGRPVFTALPQVADWRWLRTGDTSPWYPSMRLFRQTTPKDWREVMARIAAAVAEMVSAQQR